MHAKLIHGKDKTEDLHIPKEQILFRKFPELRALCWNRHDEAIPQEDACTLYLENWEFIDKTHLEEKELALLRALYWFSKGISDQACGAPRLLTARSLNST